MESGARALCCGFDIASGMFRWSKYQGCCQIAFNEFTQFFSDLGTRRVMQQFSLNQVANSLQSLAHPGFAFRINVPFDFISRIAVHGNIMVFELALCVKHLNQVSQRTKAEHALPAFQPFKNARSEIRHRVLKSLHFLLFYCMHLCQAEASHPTRFGDPTFADFTANAQATTVRKHEM